MARVWAAVLGRPAGVTDNFFEVGGSSLAIVVVRDRLAALLGRDVRVVDLFSYPTVRGLAAFLDGAVDGPRLDRAAQRAAARRDRTRRRTGTHGNPTSGDPTRSDPAGNDPTRADTTEEGARR